MQEKTESNAGWAGPILFISVAIAMLAFFIWFL
ncbi:MAG: hypothetical protein HW415_307 [Deltaproteobacteria bacterium]|nr:hypothetical protein [Deltaproteobacteria bacterium]